ncbi:putative efflux pump membrane transporter TtgB [Oligella sp. MSHR50489EDL]|uniref:multidrug efflux RND transporter permease subunit n=1 Tax=Oligella sp. MSHR50489EDL TaxID=3139409 RepID=UPI003D818527
MSNFFIHRPVFAWVLAILVSFFGLLAIPNMPVEQYPDVAPPAITISATYPGASAEEVSRSVISLIEDELNGAEGLLYYSSTADSSGRASIVVTFEPGTDQDLAQVDVQNRVSNIQSSLPQAVLNQGVRYSKGLTSFLMIVSMYSDNPDIDSASVADYITRNIKNNISRLDGVGNFQLFSAPRAMRIWVDPDKLTGYGLTMNDVTAALSAQNIPVAAGVLGAPPTDADLTTTAITSVNGELTNVDEFNNVVLRANTDGSLVQVKDVARVEIGLSSYSFDGKLDGRPVATFAINLAAGANALETASLVRQEMEILSQYFPDGISYTIPYDTAPYVQESILKVVHTLLEAVVLVFIVMFLFLQNVRYTVIPAVVVPIALLGTIAVLWVMGMSVNTMTMFAMVLSIGILVDDAIVVVENVERIMMEERIPPLQATIKAMPQIGGAIVGITLVLVTVFFPLAFMSGSSGVIYRQFAVAMAVSIAFSGFFALTFTPALCATFLKPITVGAHDRRGFFGWFNRNFDRMTEGYTSWVAKLVKRGGRMMFIYLALAIGTLWFFVRMPGSFMPDEDQGLVITNVELASGSTAERTEAVLDQARAFFEKEDAVEHVVSIRGFSFNGTGINAGIIFTPLKDFKERTATAQEISGRATGALLFGVPDATMFSVMPPPIPSLGNASGFDMYLQDRGTLGVNELRAQADQLVALASQNPKLSSVRIASLGAGPSLELKIDRAKAMTYGVNFSDLAQVLSTSLGGSYLGKFPNMGRMQDIWVQADNPYRRSPDDLLRLKVRNSAGELVELSNFVDVRWNLAQSLVQRYNSYFAVNIEGSAAPGVANGEAMAEMERLIKDNLSADIGFEWTGLSYQEIEAGSQGTILMVLSLFVVFLVLAALYESWSIPLSAVLIVPLGLLGSVAFAYFFNLSNDIYFQVGVVTVIGLATKNAILIVEFAKDAVAAGQPLFESTVRAARLRLRPILMTSFAFILGVTPLMIATGAGAAGQRTLGTGVVGGMITATVFSIFMVPIFFSVILKIFKTKPKLLGAQVVEQQSEMQSREEKDLIYSEAYPELDPYRAESEDENQSTADGSEPGDGTNKNREE